MEFAFTPQHQARRAEVRAFLQDALVEDFGPSRLVNMDNWDGQLRFLRQLGQRNWIAPAWPVEYGGQGWKHIDQMIFAEEFAYNRAPDTARTFSVGMIGPTLIVHGTPEQKAEHLPRITSGEVIWCQGYSEPQAGSDLANIQTRAVRDGDDYVVNGQKIWTTGAHHADWCFLVARTDPDLPKHKGITFLLADMRTPGITVSPIINLAGNHEFNQVFFEDVRVPVRNRVGEENNGWYVAMTLLDFERSNVASIAANARSLEDIMGVMREDPPQGVTIDILRHRLADLWVSNEVGRLLSYRIAWMQESGQRINVEASVIKILATEMGQKIANAGIGVLGPHGALTGRQPNAKLRGELAVDHMEAVSPTIYSGSNEIQRNIIATRGLGLPRD